eukprot:scaffold648939_cov47-Prasinocladus_malaysianus.AAC.1
MLKVRPRRDKTDLYGADARTTRWVTDAASFSAHLCLKLERSAATLSRQDRPEGVDWARQIADVSRT